MSILTKARESLTKAIYEPVVPASTPVVEVDERHLEYIDALINGIDVRRDDIAAKKAYMSAADASGLKIAAIEPMREDVERYEKRLADVTVVIDRIKRVLAAGGEPTSLQETWYAGQLTEPKRSEWRDPVETWPCANAHALWGAEVLVYKGAMPLSAVERLAEASPLLDDVRIYSPRRDDFYAMPRRLPHDPVLVGMIDLLGEPQYFEIARWDVDKDLAALFS